MIVLRRRTIFIQKLATNKSYDERRQLSCWQIFRLNIFNIERCKKHECQNPFRML